MGANRTLPAAGCLPSSVTAYRRKRIFRNNLRVNLLLHYVKGPTFDLFLYPSNVFTQNSGH
jgi:hypothetical protein